jgi:CelD/BcsL family acetyltransferase involved in cellulose biosynthesis/ribosomal protein S18 acetylase RimI-like enzyme
MCSLQTASPTATRPSDASLTVELYTGEEISRELLERASALDCRGPFSAEVWWDAWWKHLRPPGTELFLLTISRGGQLLGLAPWYTRRSRAYGRVVRFLADSACSDYMTIPTARDCEDEVRSELARWIAAEAGRSWDMFILTGISAADTLMGPLADEVRQHDILLDQRAIGNTWRVALPQTWDEYVELFSKRDRYRLRRVKREMLDSGRAVVRRVTSRVDFERGYEIQYRLRNLRCDSQGEESCFADLRFTAFLREASRRFLERGQLRLQWMEVDGQPIAFDSSFVDQGGVYLYQTAFDPEKADLGPGRLHLQASIAQAIEEGHRFFDFLRGDEPYKHHFRATAIPLFEMRLVAPRVRPRLGYHAWKLKKQAKAKARRWMGRTDGNAAARPDAAQSARHSRDQTPAANLTPRPLGRIGQFADDCRRFGVRAGASGLAYRLIRRSCRLTIAHVLRLDVTELAPQLRLPPDFECRWLTADEVRAFASDAANDLEDSLADRVNDGRNFCFGVLCNRRLVNYCWYSLGAISKEHSFGAGLALPTDTLFLYKAFTDPDFRGRHFHPSAVSRVVHEFAKRGISRVVALVENDNWPSLHSHAKLGFRRVGRMLVGGRRPLRTERYPPTAIAMGIRFGQQA